MKVLKLLHLLRKKKEFFQQILHLTEKGENCKYWATLLEQKKLLLARIEHIDTVLLPFKNSLHTLSEEVCTELEEIRTIIQKITHLDVVNKIKHKEQLYLDEGHTQ